MKKTKLLAATAMLLLTSCSPKVVTNICKNLSGYYSGRFGLCHRFGRKSAQYSRDYRACISSGSGYFYELPL